MTFTMNTHNNSQSIKTIPKKDLVMGCGTANLAKRDDGEKVSKRDGINLSPDLDSIGYWNSVGGGLGKIKPSGAEDTERKSGNQIWFQCSSRNKTRYLNSLNRNRFFIRYYASVSDKSDKVKGWSKGQQVKGIYQKIGKPTIEFIVKGNNCPSDMYGITLKVKRIDTIKPFQFYMKKENPNPYGWKFYGWIDRSDEEGKKDGIIFTGSTGNVIHRHPLDIVRNIQENKSIVIQRFMKSRLGNKVVTITEDERIELEKKSREILL